MYRLFKIVSIPFNDKIILRTVLDLAWFFRRISFEKSIELWGDDFINLYYDFTPEFLSTWIPVNSKIIDFGCGDGRASRIASQSGAKSVLGIDFSNDRIMMAKSKSLSYRNISYVTYDVTKSLFDQFNNYQPEIGLIIHVLEHIDDPTKFLIDLKTIVNKIIIEVPDFFCDNLNIARYWVNSRLYSDDDHVREYTINSLTDHLRSAGWNIIHLSKKSGGTIFVVAEI